MGSYPSPCPHPALSSRPPPKRVPSPTSSLQAGHRPPTAAGWCPVQSPPLHPGPGSGRVGSHTQATPAVPPPPSWRLSRPGWYQAGTPPAPGLPMNPTSVGCHRPPFSSPNRWGLERGSGTPHTRPDLFPWALGAAGVGSQQGCDLSSPRPLKQGPGTLTSILGHRHLRCSRPNMLTTGTGSSPLPRGLTTRPAPPGLQAACTAVAIGGHMDGKVLDTQ